MQEVTQQVADDGEFAPKWNISEFKYRSQKGPKGQQYLIDTGQKAATETSHLPPGQSLEPDYAHLFITGQRSDSPHRLTKKTDV